MANVIFIPKECGPQISEFMKRNWPGAARVVMGGYGWLRVVMGGYGLLWVVMGGMAGYGWLWVVMGGFWWLCVVNIRKTLMGGTANSLKLS